MNIVSYAQHFHKIYPKKSSLIVKEILKNNVVSNSIVLLFLQLILLFCGHTYIRCADTFTAHASQIIRTMQHKLILLDYHQPLGRFLAEG